MAEKRGIAEEKLQAVASVATVPVAGTGQLTECGAGQRRAGVRCDHDSALEQLSH